MYLIRIRPQNAQGIKVCSSVIGNGESRNDGPLLASMSPLFEYLVYLLFGYWYAQDKGQIYGERCRPIAPVEWVVKQKVLDASKFGVGMPRNDRNRAGKSSQGRW